MILNNDQQATLYRIEYQLEETKEKLPLIPDITTQDYNWIYYKTVMLCELISYIKENAYLISEDEYNTLFRVITNTLNKLKIRCDRISKQ